MAKKIGGHFLVIAMSFAAAVVLAGRGGHGSYLSTRAAKAVEEE